MAAVSTTRRGTLYGAGAYLLWGLFPLYWPLLRPSTAVEVLAHRILWSLVVVVALLAVLRKLPQLLVVMRDRAKLWRLSLAAVVVAINWGTYIYGVSSGQVVETSLGYFITPIVTVLLGVLVLGERLRPAQWAALGLAFVAVLVLSVENGRPPWIALVLAFSFGAEGVGHAALLALSGVVTAVPLLLFGAAASRVPLTTLGTLQYLAPTLQFLLGVTLLGEPMPPAKLLGFALVWLALALFTADVVRHHRRSLRLAVAQPA